MSPIAASQPAREMRRLQLFSVLLACLALPTHLAAQTPADRESVNRVVETLFNGTGEYTEIPHIPGTWSLVIARFARGDSREIAIPAKAGQHYQVWGAAEWGDAESVRMDIDICVYGPAGDPVDCDTDEDSVPIVFFTPKTEGTYRAVMTAVSVEGGGTSFAGMVVLRELDEGAERGGAGK